MNLEKVVFGFFILLALYSIKELTWMTIRFRLQALRMSRSRTSCRCIIAALALACTWLCGPALAAKGDSVTGLRPYTAQYTTTTRGMDLGLTRVLKAGADGTFTLTNGGKIMVVGFHEVSVFKVEGTRVIPKSYVYQGIGLINRRREVHFAPGTDTVRSLYKDQWYDLPKTDKTLDRMSQQEQLRLLLLNDPKPGQDLSIQVADGKRVKDYELVFVGEEIVVTALGPIPSLHFKRVHDDPDRKSDMWLAPAWDYLMVKTVHIEDDEPVNVIITAATIDGVAVAAQ